MVDTVRTLSALQTLLADNTAGDIGAQDVRDMLVSTYPLWDAYTPTWSASSSAPSLGDGSLSGNVLQLGTGTGSLVVASVFLTWGSSTAGGSGTWLFSLPVTGEGNNGVGFVTAYDQGSFNPRAGGVIWQDANTVQPYREGAFFTASAPFTWANTDKLWLMFVYESA